MTFGTMAASAADPDVVPADMVRALVVDEASQAWSAQTFLFDRVFPGVVRLYLYGDDRQLPPVLLAANARGDDQADAVAAGLRSLYDAAKASAHPLAALRVQYRLPRVLADFVSRHFYQGKLATPAGERFDDLGAVVWCARCAALAAPCCTPDTAASSHAASGLSWKTVSELRRRSAAPVSARAGSSQRANRGTRASGAARRGSTSRRRRLWST